MREEKKFIVEELTREMGQANPLVFTDHSKVKANGLNQLRTQLKTAQSRYRVVQNSLFQRAVKIDKQFTGPLGIAYGGRDVVEVIKTLVKFAKDNPEIFIIKGGLVDKQYFELRGLEELAKLPSKEVLLARLVGQMNAPISRFVMAMKGNLQKLVCVLDNIAKKK